MQLKKMSSCTPMSARLQIVGRRGGVSAGRCQQRPRARHKPAQTRPFSAVLAALHQFEYEDANESFRQARELDPAFVMAYWGEAMTYHQTLWRNENVDAARLTLARLGPTPAARRAKTPQREGAGVARRGRAPLRRRRRRDAPPQLRGRHGAVARAGARRSRRRLVLRARAARHDVAQPHRLRRCARRPQPGAGRQCDPDPGGGDSRRRAAVASRASGCAPLPAAQPGRPRARAVARSPPRARSPGSRRSRATPGTCRRTSSSSSGLWQDAARSDRAAFAASEAWVARKRLDAAMRNYHALAWLQVRAAPAREVPRRVGHHRRARAGRQDQRVSWGC